MRQFLKKDKVILSLFLLAGIQLLVLGVRVTRPVQVPLVWPQEGDTLLEIPVFRSDGPETQLLSGEPTVLLIFHSRCVHCAEVASLWRSWLQDYGPDWQVLAVSSEPLDSAQTYVEHQGWEVEVGVVEAGSSGGPADVLTGRAPWVFVANGAGVILAEGHGNTIAELTAGVRVRRDEVPLP